MSLSPAPLPIVQAGMPVLRQPMRTLSAVEILSPAIQQLIVRLRDTMHAAPGVGLAAPQVGEPLQLAVLEDRPEYLAGVAPELLAAIERTPTPFQVIINPRLTVTDPTPVSSFEGCLSVAGLAMLVPRARAVRVDCLNEHAEPVVIEARGWHARILQHEIDHLHGHLCIDRMEPRSLMTWTNQARYWRKKSLDEVRAGLGIPVSPAPDQC